MRSCFCLLVMFLLVTPATADLEFENIEASYGPLGPKRDSLNVMPGEQIYFRYILKNIQTDDDGRVSGELRISLSAKGKVLLDKTSEISGRLIFGGAVLPGNASIGLGLDTPPGDYLLKVTATDKLNKSSATFERTIVCRRAAFSLVRLRFSYDKEGKIPAGAGGTVGQRLFIKAVAVGFRRQNGKVNVSSELIMTDKAGKKLMPQPIRSEIKEDERGDKIRTIQFSNFVVLNRVGDFRVIITARDKLANESFRFAAPIRVVAP